jgi:hypothetical protein
MSAHGPYITVNDYFLLPQSFTFTPAVILFGLVVLYFVIYGFIKYRDTIGTANYLIISAFILFNTVFFNFYIDSMFLEISRFAGMSEGNARTILWSPEEESFYRLLAKKIPPHKKIYFAEPWDSYYKNVKTKFQLAYYLVPRKISTTAVDADYIIIVNMNEKPSLNMELPPERINKILKLNDQLILLKLKDTDK